MAEKNILEQLKHAQFLKKENKFKEWDAKTEADEFQYPPHPEIVTHPPGRAFVGLLVWILGPLLILSVPVFFCWLQYQWVATYGWTVTPVTLP